SLAQQDVWTIGPRNRQALAWEVLGGDALTIVEKYGGLHNASAYIGMMPRRKLGIVILGDRGKQYPNEVGRPILLELAASRRLRAWHASGRVARTGQGGSGPTYYRPPTPL